MFRIEPVQDAGAVQKVVNERVDGDHARPDLVPQPQLFMPWVQFPCQNVAGSFFS